MHDDHIVSKISTPKLSKRKLDVFDSASSSFPICIEKNLYMATFQMKIDDFILKQLSVKLLIWICEESGAKETHGILCFFCRAEDDPTQNLITYFEDCSRLIDFCLKNELAVLVQCSSYNYSLSSPIIASYLIKSRQMRLSDSLEYIHSRCPSIFINYGFINQLAIFERMGCQIVRTDPSYRYLMWFNFIYSIKPRLNFDVFQTNSHVSDVRPHLFKFLKELNTGADSTLAESASFHCKFCHCNLFTEVNVLKGPDWKWKSENKYFKNKQDCLSLFVEPLNWMYENEACLVGKTIRCPTCHDVLGFFDMRGMECAISSQGRVCLKHPSTLTRTFLIIRDHVFAQYSFSSQ